MIAYLLDGLGQIFVVVLEHVRDLDEQLEGFVAILRSFQAIGERGNGGARVGFLDGQAETLVLSDNGGLLDGMRAPIQGSFRCDDRH